MTTTDESKGLDLSTLKPGQQVRIVTDDEDFIVLTASSQVTVYRSDQVKGISAVTSNTYGNLHDVCLSDGGSTVSRYVKADGVFEIYGNDVTVWAYALL